MSDPTPSADPAIATNPGVAVRGGGDLCLVGWMTLLLPHGAPPVWAFPLLGVAEMLVPPLVELKAPTTWHPRPRPSGIQEGGVPAGYGHFAVFGSAAVIGAGLKIAVDYGPGPGCFCSWYGCCILGTPSAA